MFCGSLCRESKRKSDGASVSGCQNDVSNDFVMAMQGAAQAMMSRLDAL